MFATFKSVVLLCAVLPFTALCANHSVDKPLISNTPPPYWVENERDTLNILAIGNSFTEDALANMPYILREKRDSTILVAALTRSGGSLEELWNNHERREKKGYTFSERSAAGWKGYSEISCLDAALTHRKWDVVVLQQVSGLSGKKDTYEPYLSKLMALIAEQQPQAKILFHKTWSYSRTSDHWDYGKYHNSQEEMCDSIDRAVSAIKDRFAMVIPSGDLLNALRQTRFNTDKDLTRDGYHLATGFPQYAVSLLWYDMMIAPVTGKETFPINFRSTPNDLNSIPTTDEMMEEIEFHIHRLQPNKVNTTGIDAVCGFQEGNITISREGTVLVVMTSKEQMLPIYNISGSLVTTMHLQSGRNTIELPAGIYIIGTTKIKM